MDRKVWFAVHIKSSHEATEAIEFALNSLDALGTEVIDFPKQDREIVTVTGYFDLLPDAIRLQDELENGLSIYGLSPEAVVSITTDEIENTDWLAEWKRHWKPSKIGRFVIAAPWHELDETEKIVIRIEPNMAFGTGTHETTQLCIKAIDKYYSAGDSFLDVGTGTGILSMAAAKVSTMEGTEYTEAINLDLRTASGEPTENSFPSVSSVPSVVKIFAIDNDPDSIKIARDNAELNGVQKRVEFQIGTLTLETPHYDFICANLTLDVILPILRLLIEKANHVLVLSGILAEQEKTIINALAEHGFPEAEITRASEWIAVTVHKD